MTEQKTRLAITLVQQSERLVPPVVLQEIVVQAFAVPHADMKVLGHNAVDFELEFDPAGIDALKAALLSALPEAIDVCVQPAEGRLKKLLLCDMDSTIIQQECIDELADYAGIKEQIAAITERAMQGELDFEAALTERVGLLKGLPVSALQQCFEERIRLTPGARTLVQTMKASGATCQLVSGGFTFFTSRVSEVTGFDADFANTLIDDGKALTGEVGRPILGRQAKLDRLQATAASLGIALEDSITIGDGANDMAMIEAAGLGIGFNPHPVLAKAARAVISGPSLTTALYFMGIPETEWVSE